jgi:hypothetical protein
MLIQIDNYSRWQLRFCRQNLADDPQLRLAEKGVIGNKNSILLVQRKK